MPQKIQIFFFAIIATVILGVILYYSLVTGTAQSLFRFSTGNYFLLHLWYYPRELLIIAFGIFLVSSPLFFALSKIILTNLHFKFKVVVYLSFIVILALFLYPKDILLLRGIPRYPNANEFEYQYNIGVGIYLSTADPLLSVFDFYQKILAKLGYGFLEDSRTNEYVTVDLRCPGDYSGGFFEVTRLENELTYGSIEFLKQCK